MDESKAAANETKETAARVLCRRIDLPMPLAEHLSCPYCFGDAKAVASGRHRDFCDFKKGKDPICFGYPRM